MGAFIVQIWYHSLRKIDNVLWEAPMKRFFSLLVLLSLLLSACGKSEVPQTSADAAAPNYRDLDEDSTWEKIDSFVYGALGVAGVGLGIAMPLLIWK